MQLYITGNFVSRRSGDKKGNVLSCVLNDRERDNLVPVQQKMQARYEELKAQKALPRWTKNDTEVLEEILPWAMHYDQGGKMLDLTEDQIEKIQKTINKLWDEPESFLDMAGITLDRGVEYDDPDTYMDRLDMKREMDRRRKIETSSKTNNTFSKLFCQ